MRRIALAVASALVVALAGCGGTKPVRSESSVSAGPNDPKAFTAEVDAVCKLADVNSIREGSKNFGSHFERYLPKLRALRPPPDELAIYRQFLATADRMVKEFHAGHIAAAFRAGAQGAVLRHRLHVSDHCGLPGRFIRLPGPTPKGD